MHDWVFLGVVSSQARACKSQKQLHNDGIQCSHVS